MIRTLTTNIGFQFIWQPKTATTYLQHVLQLKVEDLTKQEDKETIKFILTCSVMIQPQHTQ